MGKQKSGKEKKEGGGKFRDRKFMMLLYPDNASHVKALDMLKKTYDIAYILHDKDVYEEDVVKDGEVIHSKGEIKKAHWHVVVLTGTNAIWNTAFAKTLDIDVKFVGTQVGNRDKALEYLIHFNDLDKHQYSLEEVHGNLKTRLKILIKKDGRMEEEKVLEIIKYIKEHKENLDLIELTLWACENGNYDALRRSQSWNLAIISQLREKQSLKEKEKVKYKHLDVNTGEILEEKK